MSNKTLGITARLHSNTLDEIVAFSNEIVTPTNPSDLEHSAFTRQSDINEELSRKTRLHKIPVNLLLFTKEDPVVSLSNADLIDLLGCNASEFESSFANTEVVFSVQEKKYTQPKTFAVLSEYTKDNNNVHRFVGIDGNLTIVLSFLIAENQQHVVQYTEGFLEVHETETTVTDGSVTTAKLHDGAVTSAKLDSSIANAVSAVSGKQDQLVSGTNIKTVNSQSLLGSGNIRISGQILSDWNQNDISAIDYIKNKPTGISEFTNDANYLTTIPSNSVTTVKIANDAVTSDKISNASVTKQKLSTELQTLLDVTGASGNNSILTMSMEYTDDEISNISESKANVATTLAGYGITDAYTKGAVDNMVSALTASDIVVTEGPLPASGAANTIYRLKGSNSYTDNMYYDNSWIELAEYNNAIDTTPIKDSENLITSGGVFDHLNAIDISELNSSNGVLPAYASLSNAIEAIPSDYQKGGIVIKFIEDITNEYKWYKLISPTWTSNTTAWALIQNNIVVDNNEWLLVVIDNDNKILFGIKQDGSVDWSSGVPQPISDAIDDSYLNSIDKINSIGYTVDGSSKYIRAYLDQQEHLLWGIDNLGDIHYGCGVPSLIKEYIDQNSNDGKFIIVSKNGGGDYSSFSKAVLDNMDYWNITIYLNEGEYDILDELSTYYGTQNFLQLTPCGRGIELGHDIKIIGSPNAIIKADYLGNDQNMQKNFSPLNCLNTPNSGGFTLSGVNIQCSKVRYCVHDEKGNSGVGTYRNIYENCSFYIDNTYNDYWHSSQCIGGGLGHSGNIIIRNCIFEQIEPTSIHNASVSYHNNKMYGAKSIISCIGNYIKGERGFRFSWYGDSEEMTQVICCGNNVGLATQFRAETTPDSEFGPSNIENVVLYDWNNIIRNT